MKKIINYLLIFCLSLNLPIQAGEVYDQADQQVKKSIEQADNIGKILALNDLQESFTKIITKLLNEKTAEFKDETYTNLVNDIAAIETELITLSKTSATGTTKELDARVMQAMSRYQSLTMGRLRSTYIVAEKRLNFVKLKSSISQTLEDYNQVCKTGKSIENLNLLSGQIPRLPKPSIEIGMSIGNSTENWGTESFNYSSSYGVNPEKEEEFAKINQTLQTSAGLTYSMSMGAATTASSAAIVEGAAVMGPWVLGAAVLFAVYSDITMSNELYKKQIEIFNANVHLFKNTANHNHVIESYKTHCKTNMAQISQLTNLIDKIDENPNNNIELYNLVTQSKDLRLKWETKKSELIPYYASLYVINNLDKECNSEVRISKNQSLNKCEIPYNKNFDIDEGKYNIGHDDIIDLKETLITKIEEYENEYTNEKTTYLKTHNIIDSMLSIAQVNTDGLKNINWKKLEGIQKRALGRIILLTSVLRNQKYVDQYKIEFLEKELGITGEFEIMRQEMQDLVAFSIDFIFDNYPYSELKNKSISFDKKWTAFFKLYGKSNELKNFNQNWLSLSSSIESFDEK